MIRDIFWETVDNGGFEHLKVTNQKDLYHFDSIIIRKLEDKVIRVFYQLVCDTSWKFRKLELTIDGNTKKSLSLNIDKSGLWYDDKGAWYQQLKGCIDPDISLTPSTNALPINRLNLNEGEAKEIKVAYINLPELTVSPVRQSYKCISKNEDGGIYLYKNYDSGVEAEIQVGKDSFVVNYPDLFRRV